MKQVTSGAYDERLERRRTSRRHQLGSNIWTDPESDPQHAARWVQLMVDGLYLRCSDADFDADTEVSRLRIVLSRALLLRDS